jgi:hypothetical protein
LFVSVGGATTTQSDAGFAQEEIDPDDILLEIAIEEDGSATWTVEYRTRLETDEDVQAFEELRADIESNPDTYVERFQNRMDATAGEAENATGREMAITDTIVSARKEELPQERGVITYTFRWRNFAAVEGDRLLVGDAIDGLFLDEETALLVTWPDGYELLDASPAPGETRERSVVYNGPTSFATGESRIVLGPPGAATETDGLLGSSLAIAGLVGLLIIVAAAAFVGFSRRDGVLPAGTDISGDSGSADERSGGGGGPPPDPELLSNEEQVLQLIERQGGRMKQKEVAEQLGWTDAKTSQVTKGLREAGDLEGFRLGRENVLALPEEDSE